ncbi:MAG: hypothetical protein NVSMB23_11770 [Myxococcales bacterium]
MSVSKTSAPVVGFNANVQHAGQKFHVQTEDSGLPHAHYITHLFLGGNIVASVKSSYADRIQEHDLPKVVRQLMGEQTKLLLRRLVAGEFAEQVARLTAAQYYEPGVLATGETGPAAVNVAAASPIAAGALGGRPLPSGTLIGRGRPPGPHAKASPQAPVAKPAAPAPPVWQPSPPTASPAPAAARLPGAPLPSTSRAAPPPKPANLPPRLVPVAEPTARSTPRAPLPAVPPLPRVPASVPRAIPRAPLVPAAKSLFAEPPIEAPHEDLPTLFAEELISEKSLDEVILAFLSADTEPPK